VKMTSPTSPHLATSTPSALHPTAGIAHGRDHGQGLLLVAAASTTATVNLAKGASFSCLRCYTAPDLPRPSTLGILLSSNSLRRGHLRSVPRSAPTSPLCPPSQEHRRCITARQDRSPSHTSVAPTHVDACLSPPPRCTDRCHRVTSPRQSSPSRTVGKSRPCCPIPWGPDVDAYLTRGQQPLPAGRALFFHGMAAPVLRRRSCDAPRTPAGRRKPRSSAASPATSTTRSNLRNPVGANLDVDNILP
jgi:hypothetical protein